MTTLKEIIEYALIEKGLVHQLGAEFITAELAPFIAEKVEAKLNKDIDIEKVAEIIDKNLDVIEVGFGKLQINGIDDAAKAVIEEINRQRGE